jgi:hypothetical protein
MNYENILAAGLSLDIDFETMTEELLNVITSDKCQPFSYTDTSGNLCNAFSLFLRVNSTMEEYSYRGAKLSTLENWDWDQTLNIPHTITEINKLPFCQLGIVRVVYFPNIPCVEHTDWDDSTNLKNTLGLSLIPSTGETHCNVWSEKLQEYVSIPGNAMLLNDSVKHWVPISTGTRITMRLFGDIDYNWFNDKIIAEHCHTL